MTTYDELRAEAHALAKELRRSEVYATIIDKAEPAALLQLVERWRQDVQSPGHQELLRAMAHMRAQQAAPLTGDQPAIEQRAAVAPEDPWKVLAKYGVTRDAPPTATAPTATAPTMPTPRAAAIRVPRVKGGLRAIDSPKLKGLHQTYRLVWKAMYAMADRAPDRTIKKGYWEIAAAVRRRGARISDETAGHAVRYLATIGVVKIVQAPARVQKHRGRHTTEPGIYQVPVLGSLALEEIQARVRANPVAHTNPSQARRNQKFRQSKATSPSPF